jgi:SAM-dependent methyltransferase
MRLCHGFNAIVKATEYGLMYEAEESHWWYAGLHDLIIQMVRAEAKRLKRPLTMLDAGCGTGRLCQLLEPFGVPTGCDIHPLALDGAAKRGVRILLQRDVGCDPLGEEEFDLAAAIDVLYHRMVGDEIAALRNLHRALTRGGLLLVQVPAFEALRGAHDIAVHTRKRYKRGEVIRLLRSVGFRVEMASYRLMPFFLPCLARRLCTRHVSTGTHVDEYSSDLGVNCSPGTNRILTRLVRAENFLLARGISLPLGTSVFAMARK